MAPGTRLDLIVRAPAEGDVARIIDQRLGESVTLARLIGTGTAPPRKPFDPAPLRASQIPEPRLAEAERLEFVFAAAGSSAPVIAASADPLSAIGLGSLCLSANDYWTINDIGWPSGDPRLPKPLAVLERGRSYRFSLKNDSQLMHPIHIHGHSFKLLGSDKRTLPVHHSDTILLTPGETIEAAFVADNPGRWMLHCHVIEHQESGMMAFVEVV
jgi:FtsP/CotA-like multicopper oxidase with cupredoxin domain